MLSIKLVVAFACAVLAVPTSLNNTSNGLSTIPGGLNSTAEPFNGTAGVLNGTDEAPYATIGALNGTSVMGPNTMQLEIFFSCKRTHVWSPFPHFWYLRSDCHNKHDSDTCSYMLLSHCLTSVDGFLTSRENAGSPRVHDCRNCEMKSATIFGCDCPTNDPLRSRYTEVDLNFDMRNDDGILRCHSEQRGTRCDSGEFGPVED